MDEQKKKMLIIGGISVLAVVVIILGSVMMNHKKKVESSATTMGYIAATRGMPSTTYPATTRGMPSTTYPATTRPVPVATISPHNKGDVLKSGDSLYPGDFLQSPNGQHVATFGGTMGRLTLSDGKEASGGTTQFSGFDPTAIGDKLYMQPEGNVIIFSADNKVAWYSSFSGNDGSYLQLQNDGTLQIMNKSGSVYSSIL